MAVDGTASLRIGMNDGESHGTAPQPIFLPEMAAWVRPVWIATWVAESYGALVLLPVLLPVYGSPLPGWVWWGIPVQSLGLLGLAAYRKAGNPKGVRKWMAAGVATTGTSFIFTVGLYIVIKRDLTDWDVLGLAAFGVFGLGFLMALDRFGFSPYYQGSDRNPGIPRAVPGPPTFAGAQAMDVPWFLLAVLVALILVILAVVL